MNRFPFALAAGLVLAGAGHAQQDPSQSMRRPPPPPMMRGFALDSATTTAASNVHLFALDLMPPGGRGPRMLGVNGQAPTFGGLDGYGVDATAATTAAAPRGHAMIAGQHYRLVNVTMNGGTGTLTPGQPPTSLTAYLATAGAPGSGTVVDTGATTAVGQLALTFQQIEGQTVFTGSAQTDQGSYSLLGSLERPGGPGGPGGPRGPGGQGASYGGQTYGQGNGQVNGQINGQVNGQASWQGTGQTPWSQGNGQGSWQGTSQTGWQNGDPSQTGVQTSFPPSGYTGQ